MKTLFLTIIIGLLYFSAQAHSDEPDNKNEKDADNYISPSEVILSGEEDKWSGQGIHNKFVGGNLAITANYKYFLLKEDANYLTSDTNDLQIKYYPYNVGLGSFINITHNLQLQGWGGYERYIYDIKVNNFYDDIEPVSSDGWFARTELKALFKNRILPVELRIGGGYNQTSHLYGVNYNASAIAYVYKNWGLFLGYQNNQFKTHDTFLPPKLDSQEFKIGIALSSN